jgi:hypothetical protein
MMDEITYRGIDSLDAVEKATMERICPKEFSKIKRSLTTGSLIIDVKKLNKAGKRVVYNIKARVDAPSIKLYAEHSDWELQRVLHRTFDNLKMEVEHKFKKKEVKWPNRIMKE